MRGHPLVSGHAEAVRATGIAVVEVPGAASERALPPDVDVVLCASTDDGRTAGAPADSTVLVGAADLPGAHVLDLVAVMDRLRSPGGCPWDARQTHESLAPYAVEEAYELAEAVADGDRAEIADELGDVLLQVAFHARVAQEDADDPFDLDHVADRIVAKLRRRHPHVFADASVTSAETVESNWEAIKAAEMPERAGPLDGIPVGQPPLERATKTTSRARKAGLGAAWDAAVGVTSEATLGPDEHGDILLRAVVAAKNAGVDPAAALRHALARAVARLDGG